MYTIQENVRIVISLLKQYNIRLIVVSPGGTNIPISQAVQDDPFFTCYSIPDERSAMYFAIGLYLQTGEIVATSCTSAQATRNYVPGLTEAFYKHTPILAITTSKLERFQYQDYMQAPDQTSLPKDAVKKSYDLPPVIDENTRVQCISNARNAILELTHRNFGPIQLNIRITDTEQSQFTNINLPNIREIKRYMAWDAWDDINLKDKKILVVIGEHRPFTIEQNKAINDFCENYNVVVYTNHFSNYHGKYSISANLLVSCGGLNYLQPDLFITIGGQTGDYPIYGALNNLQKVEHWRVSLDGDVVDTYNKLTKIFECPDYFFFNRFKTNEESSHDYYDSWKTLDNTLNYDDIEIPFSNLYVAQQLHNRIPSKSIMNFAILNSIRCWSYFSINTSIQCYANISAFGIDGCNSMLFGESMNTEELCFIVTGDLAYFYDMNALGIRHIKNNVRILLINNGGGAEFNFMTRKWTADLKVERFIAANGHNGNTRGWAENCGFEYLQASEKKGLTSQINKFINHNDRPIIFEIFTDPNSEVTAIEEFIEQNKIQSSEDKLKSVIKKIVGNDNISRLKKIIKK